MKFGTAASPSSEQPPRRSGRAGTMPPPGLAADEDSWPLPDPGGLRPEAWVLPPDPDCSIGQQLFDPRHGVVLVQRVEWRDRDGQPTEYLTLDVVGQPLVLLVPRETMGAGALRRLTTYDEATAVLDELRREPVALPPWTTMAFAKMQRQMLGRNPLAVAAGVRDLAAKGRRRNLSPTDRGLLERGAALLASELGVALGVGAERARRMIDAAMDAQPVA